MGRANIIMAVGFMHGLHLSVIHSLSILCKCILFHVSVRSHFSSALKKLNEAFSLGKLTDFIWARFLLVFYILP